MYIMYLKPESFCITQLQMSDVSVWHAADDNNKNKAKPYFLFSSMHTYISYHNVGSKISPCDSTVLRFGRLQPCIPTKRDYGRFLRYTIHYTIIPNNNKPHIKTRIYIPGIYNNMKWFVIAMTLPRICWYRKIGEWWIGKVIAITNHFMLLLSQVYISAFLYGVCCY